jgi:uncharacterized membrane protein
MDKSPSFSFVARRNNSLSRSGALLVLLPLAFVMLAISMAFALRGAWLIVPFAGLEFLVVWLAFRHLARHARDYESITVRDDKIVIRIRRENEQKSVEFHPYWVQVEQQRGAVSGYNPVILRSHGKEVRVGAHLTDEERAALAHRLRRHLRARREPAN